MSAKCKNMQQKLQWTQVWLTSIDYVGLRRFVTRCKIAPYTNSLTYLLTYSSNSPKWWTWFNCWITCLHMHSVLRKTGLQVVNVEECIIPVQTVRQLVLQSMTRRHQTVTHVRISHRIFKPSTLLTNNINVCCPMCDNVRWDCSVCDGQWLVAVWRSW